jgi:hypothetical protein
MMSTTHVHFQVPSSIQPLGSNDHAVQPCPRMDWQSEQHAAAVGWLASYASRRTRSAGGPWFLGGFKVGFEVGWLVGGE